MKVLFYSHDSFGLGHIRRTVNLAGAVLGQSDETSALVVTGSPEAHTVRFPERCDYVKVPSVTKDVDGVYATRDLQLGLDATITMRSILLRDATAAFDPQVVVVDHAPLGLCGELQPVLDGGLGGPGRFARVLGMRDVIDAPFETRAAWKREGIVEALRRHYDLILVYGQREVFDPIEAYGIPKDVAERMVFTGYIPRGSSEMPAGDVARRFAPRTGRLVVVTAGGGGDGAPLFESFLRGYATLGATAPFEVLVVTGPLMRGATRGTLAAAASELAGVTLVDRFADMPAAFRDADFVLSMGGYNTICELACAGAKAMIVPRCFPRREQCLRACCLQRRGVVTCGTGVPDGKDLVAAALAGLDAPRPAPGWGLDFGGLERAASAILDLAREHGARGSQVLAARRAGR